MTGSSALGACLAGPTSSARRARCRSRPQPRGHARATADCPASEQVLKLAERLAPIGSRNAISDAGVGALLAVAALRGAVLNVQINLRTSTRTTPCARSPPTRWNASSTASTIESTRSASRSKVSSVTARLLDGRALAGHLRTELRDRVERLATTVGHGHPPVLAILSDGHHGAASMYAASLERAAKGVGVETELIVDGDALVPAIERLNVDPRVAGIVVAQPFEDVAAGRRLVEHIDPEKDVDGATPTSAGRLARGEPAFVPRRRSRSSRSSRYEVPVAGLQAVIVGRSAVVGRPVFSLLLARDATVVVCHTRTRDLAAETQRADLIVAAAGVPGLIRGEMVPRRRDRRRLRHQRDAGRDRRRRRLRRGRAAGEGDHAGAGRHRSGDADDGPPPAGRGRRAEPQPPPTRSVTIISSSGTDPSMKPRRCIVS